MKRILKYMLVSIIFVVSCVSAFADWDGHKIDSEIVDDLYFSAGFFKFVDSSGYTELWNLSGWKSLGCYKISNSISLYCEVGSTSAHLEKWRFKPNGELERTNDYDYNTDTGLTVVYDNNIETNLPIFETQTDYNNYKNGGGFENAENLPDIIPQPELEDDLPKPEKISLSNNSLKQNQNIFVNDVTFTVTSSDLAQLQGTIECAYWVDIDLLRVHTVTGVTQNTILTDSSNGHTGNTYITGVNVYENGVCTVTIPASALNEQVQKIYQAHDIAFSGVNAGIISNQLYLNKLSISARSEYVQGTEYVIGSWSPSLTFTYNYVTKSASAYESPEHDDPTDSTDVPATPNDETPNGYNDNNNGGQYNIQIKNDYPKYNLYNNLNKTLNGSGELKNQMDNAFGFFDSASHSGYLSILASFMPYISDDYWNLFKIAISSALSFGIIGCIFRFLRG